MDNLRFFEIYRSSEYLGLLFDGILISAGLTIAAGLLGVALALVLASVRYWQVPGIDWFAAAYVDFIRNTPLIVQLFFIAFGLPAALGYTWPFWAHALTRSDDKLFWLFCGNFSSGFASIPVGQREAAAALNLSKKTIFRHIVLPQTVMSPCSRIIE